MRVRREDLEDDPLSASLEDWEALSRDEQDRLAKVLGVDPTLEDQLP